MIGATRINIGTGAARPVNPVRFGGDVTSPRTSAVAKGLRVLMVVESSGGGTGRHVLDLAEGLDRTGCEVHVIYSPRRADSLFLSRLVELDGVCFTALDMHTGIHPADYAVARAIRRYRRTHGPFDIIHGHSSKGGALARLAGIGSGAAVFYTLHGLIMMDPGLARWKRAMYLGIELGLSLSTARIIAVSPEEARAAVRLRLGRERVVTIPNGVGSIQCTPRAEARRALGVDEANLLIGFVGRLVEQKAPHVLVQAFATVARELPHARLVMVGDGPLRAATEALAVKLAVSDKILWLGERDARDVLLALDLFALSSRKEGLPYVILEAMAVGLPVVATAASGVEILIEPRVNGHVVPTDDPVAFARALHDIGSDTARRLSMGQASLRRIRDFSVEAMVTRTLDMYIRHRTP